MRNLSVDSRSPCQDSQGALPAYKSRELTLEKPVGLLVIITIIITVIIMNSITRQPTK
jgi:hypothetical protein